MEWKSFHENLDFFDFHNFDTVNNLGNLNLAINGYEFQDEKIAH